MAKEQDNRLGLVPTDDTDDLLVDRDIYELGYTRTSGTGNSGQEKDVLGYTPRPAIHPEKRRTGGAGDFKLQIPGIIRKVAERILDADTEDLVIQRNALHSEVIRLTRKVATLENRLQHAIESSEDLVRRLQEE